MDDGIDHAALRTQLEDRRSRLTHVIGEVGEASDLVRLLREVDGALERMRRGTYGICEACHTSIGDVLLANPVTPYCLCELSEQQQVTLQRDLELATRIQWSLLPKQDLAASGWHTHFRYEPVGATSGDYCDLVPAPDGKALHFLVGDVSGKGVAASFLMAHLNAMFRTMIEAGLPVAAQIERANRLLIEHGIATHYATMVCGRADEEGGVELCNAGHCLPLVVRGDEVLEVPSSGLPIGLFGGRSYTVSRVATAPDDTLFLYTDGVTETEANGGEQYGVPRLREFLARSSRLGPAALAAACLADLDAFRGGAPRQDDLTVLVLRRTA